MPQHNTANGEQRAKGTRRRNHTKAAKQRGRRLKKEQDEEDRLANIAIKVARAEERITDIDWDLEPVLIAGCCIERTEAERCKLFQEQDELRRKVRKWKAELWRAELLKDGHPNEAVRPDSPNGQELA